MLLREEIEQSFGNGPAHRPIEDVLVAGRRGVRRRRTVAGVATAVATLAVLGATYAVTAPGSGAAAARRSRPTPPRASAPAVDEDGNTFDLGSDAEVTLTEDGGSCSAPTWSCGSRSTTRCTFPRRSTPSGWTSRWTANGSGSCLGSGPGSGWGVSSARGRRVAGRVRAVGGGLRGGPARRDRQQRVAGDRGRGRRVEGRARGVEAVRRGDRGTRSSPSSSRPGGPTCAGSRTPSAATGTRPRTCSRPPS